MVERVKALKSGQRDVDSQWKSICLPVNSQDWNIWDKSTTINPDSRLSNKSYFLCTVRVQVHPELKIMYVQKWGRCFLTTRLLWCSETRKHEHIRETDFTKRRRRWELCGYKSKGLWRVRRWRLKEDLLHVGVKKRDWKRYCERTNIHRKVVIKIK